MKSESVLVNRKDIRLAGCVKTEFKALEPGEILAGIERFSVTTNNVTYAATGEQLGYWKFFPCDEADRGIVPVWGFARVLESRNGQIAPGERLYGFWPMGRHLVMKPDRIADNRFTDVSEHRAGLPPVYNSYMRLAGDAGTDPDMDDRMALLQPLFATSWLLADFLADNDWFDAEQVIIGSASSKTGIGLAQFIGEMRPQAPSIVGLTSAGNRNFVVALGDCDTVVTYDRIAHDIGRKRSVFVDMAGNAEVRTALHEHLGELMAHSAAVGTSHWDRFAPTGKLPGAKPVFFFAPAQIVKRREEWGPGVAEKRIGEGWRRLAVRSRDWLTVDHHHGLDGACDIYSRIASGQSRPDHGHAVIL